MSFSDQNQSHTYTKARKGQQKKNFMFVFFLDVFKYLTKTISVKHKSQHNIDYPIVNSLNKNTYPSLLKNTLLNYIY